MTSLENLEARVAALEAQLGPVRRDAAAARVLAGGADRDVAAFGGRLDMHKSLLDALRETQVEQGARIDALRETQVEHGARLDRLEQELRSGFSTLAIGQAEIVTLLNRLVDPDGAPA